MPENSLGRDRWIRIFCDYSADPVWARSSGNCDLGNLPVSQALLDRMRAWSNHYERMPLSGGVLDWNEGRAHGTEGLAIAREVKRQLPDWTVVYHDEAALEREWMRGKTLRRIRARAARRRRIVSKHAERRQWEREHRRRRYRAHFEYEIGPQF